MNFLEICQRVNTLSGLQGSFSDVSSTKDLQKNIAEGLGKAGSPYKITGRIGAL